MGEFQTYLGYRDSGIAWAPECPEGWDVVPTFAASVENRRSNSAGAIANVLSLSYGRIVRRDVETNFGLLPESFNTYQIVQPGHIVMRLTDLQNDKRSLRVGFVEEEGIITSAYLGLQFNQRFRPKFAYYLLHAYDLYKVYYGMGGGLRQTMKFSDLKWLPLFCPPVSEQENIAAFLDHETTKIDHLIAKQERLIELLKEKRQAVISHAVTRGLNPDAPMKDSGVEWLGEVPAHWASIQTRLVLLNIEQGKSPECENRIATADEWGVLKTGCVNWGRFREEEHKALPADTEPDDRYEVKAGDLLMSRASGSLEHIGSVAYVTECRQGLLLSDKVFRLITSPAISPRYLGVALSSRPTRTQIESSISGAEGLANNITKETIRSLRIALPPLDEQVTILHAVDKKLATIDKLVGKAEEAVKLMKEHRTALISAAVTGKIDVRGWQNPNNEPQEAATAASI